MSRLVSLSGLLLVVFGGGIGAGARFVIGTYVTRLYGGLFPMGTFLVNVSGSFAIGATMSLLLDHPGINPAWRYFLVTGILGGYTTFSSFEWETLTAWRAGSILVALANVLLSVGLGFLGVWLGFVCANRLRRL
jgi:fluoride exporter